MAGGLRLLFAQTAKARRATVIGTTSSETKITKDAGTDHAILYRDDVTVKRVIEITDGKGAEAAFDGVGKNS
jgi:NADPH2:quinone reductase